MRTTPAGRLRHRVEIQRLDDLVLVSGGTTEDWATVATVWASVEPVRGRELLRGHVIHGDTTHMITMRYRADLTRKHRILWGSRVFDVVDPRNVEERGIDMAVQAIERDT